MITKVEFISRIKTMKGLILSKTRKASYKNFYVNDNLLTFERVNTGKKWKLNIDQLYKIYSKNIFINTTVIKNSIGGRINSPSVAILIEIGCIDVNGYRID